MECHHSSGAQHRARSTPELNGKISCLRPHSFRRQRRAYTWHCLRHTFASRLVMAGVDLRTVADLMGHANIQMTMRYAHLAQAHKADALKKLSAFNAAERKRQQAVILFPAGQ